MSESQNISCQKCKSTIWKLDVERSHMAYDKTKPFTIDGITKFTPHNFFKCSKCGYQLPFVVKESKGSIKISFVLTSKK